MNILIHGAGFLNKGAQLMLETTCRRLRDSAVDADLFVSPVPGDQEQRMMLGLGAVYPPVEHWDAGMKSGMRRLAYPLVVRYGSRLLGSRAADMPMNSMDAFIDVSGYAFADRFGVDNLDRTVRITRCFRKRGRPVVFLPQMWGPFGDPRVARAMTGLAGNADLLYARDRISLQCLAGLGLAEQRFKQAPDISISLPGSNRAVQTPGAPFCCLVPNHRMIDRGKWGARHEALLARAALLAREQGVEPVLVVHEDTAEDHRLARSIADSLGHGATVFFDDDPTVLKAFISKSHCLIGSRYHAVVAALSQGVPALAMGWAHKYPEVLADFGCGPLAFDETDSDDEILRSVRGLLDPENNNEHRARVGEAVQELQAKNEEMWAEVIALLQPISNR